MTTELVELAEPQPLRYVVLKASGSRFAYVQDTQVGRTIKRYDILRGYDKGNGWVRANEHAKRLNEPPAAPEPGGGGVSHRPRLRGWGGNVSLRVVPCTQKQAKEYVTAHHRHHRAPQGGLFALACMDDDRLCGVAIVGRPVAQALDNGTTCEVTRVCTDGTRNACSILYGRARRAAAALGYQKIITYTLPEEGGASLRATGWDCEGAAGGMPWNCKNRQRADDHPLQRKLRWGITLGVAT